MWKELTTLPRLGQSALRNASRVQIQTRTTAPRTLPAIAHGRSFHAFSALRTTKEQKGEEDRTHDRHVLDPQRSEVTKSGTDNEVAAHPAAYDPHRTSPESEIAATEEESQYEGKVSNPLDMSPANKETSKARPPKEGGAVRNAEKEKPSSRGSARKHGEVKVGKQ
ncbi:uncharacterized protein KD926_004036 [Aspergillus affinis]|uniref:uncharacterized protein n=1 Tax=Aspergillus affinis TaxID=1070780 RepID=UPI0022FE181B|nr:uncharacterized protein KD926_004036 [Aspergillus affinis]KAI9046198.1 hypothetical protein KD926_004036 [Aspergillus affinis]